jgi:hypothetical protein
MSISDEDTDAGSDFIELQPISEYEESKENIYLGIDPISEYEESKEEEEEVLMQTITCAILVNPSSAFSLFLFIVFSYLIFLNYIICLLFSNILMLTLRKTV